MTTAPEFTAKPERSPRHGAYWSLRVNGYEFARLRWERAHKGAGDEPIPAGWNVWAADRDFERTLRWYLAIDRAGEHVRLRAHSHFSTCTHALNWRLLPSSLAASHLAASQPRSSQSTIQ